MRKPGVSLLDMADQVGEQVEALARTAGHDQTPAFYSRVIGGRHVCLAGCGAPPGPAVAGGAETVRICREVEQVTSLATLGVLHRQYGGSPAGECIAARINELQAGQQIALQTKTETANKASPAAQPDRKTIIESAVKALRDATSRRRARPR